MRGIGNVLEHIVFLGKRFKNFDSGFIARVIMLEVGISAKQEGFNCIREAILYRLDNPDASLTKEIYPAIAKTKGACWKASNVERAIRSAIETAWRQRDVIWDSYFLNPKCPTNGEFISRLAAMVELWQDCAAMEKGRREMDGQLR